MQASPKRGTAWDLRRLVGSVNQLRFNDKQGEVSFFGQKMIIMRRDVFRVVRDGLERLVGDQAAPFLSFLASGIGIHEGSIFRESVQGSSEQERRAGLENLVHSALEDTNLGLGKVLVTSVDFERGEARIAITNCFEALENGASEAPNCVFASGFLAGVFAEILDKTVQADEVKCISQGGSQCEFQISPANESQGVEPGQGEKTVEEKGLGDKDALKAAGVSTSEKKEGKASLGVQEKAVASTPRPEGSTGPAGADFDLRVERASRIAKRKKSFWDRMFK